MDPASPLLQTICRYLNENELFYVFTGELALRMLGMGGEVRTVELTVNLTSEEDAKFRNFLMQEGFEADGPGRGAAPIMRQRGSGLRLCVRPARGPADMAAIGRRVPATLDFQRFFIPATEDLLLGLLQDEGGPNRQAVRLYTKWRDHLDLGYLVATARSRGIYDRFIRMKKEAER
jgi:hypothetical protein